MSHTVMLIYTLAKRAQHKIQRHKDRNVHCAFNDCAYRRTKTPHNRLAGIFLFNKEKAYKFGK